MRITSIVECSARVLFRLASLPAQTALSAEKLSELENIPRDYVDQILQRLRKAALINSHRGAQGGYSLAKPPEAVTVGEMMRAVEGQIFEDVCGRYSSGENECHHHLSGCGIRPVWQRLASLVEGFLDHVTLAQLLAEESSVRRTLVGPPVKWVDFGRTHGNGQGESRDGVGEDPSVHPV